MGDKRQVQVMFQDEAGFGRIFLPRNCWAPAKMRPQVPAHHIREMRYALGAVAPQTGAKFFLVMPRCDTACMSRFLKELADYFPDKYIVLLCDNAIWHRAKTLVTPENIMILHIPPYTPEMNPIEQVWGYMRREGFVNRVFQTLEHVIDQLCQTINNLAEKRLRSITHREWLYKTILD